MRNFQLSHDIRQIMAIPDIMESTDPLIPATGYRDSVCQCLIPPVIPTIESNRFLAVNDKFCKLLLLRVYYSDCLFENQR